LILIKIDISYSHNIPLILFSENEFYFCLEYLAKTVKMLFLSDLNIIFLLQCLIMVLLITFYQAYLIRIYKKYIFYLSFYLFL